MALKIVVCDDSSMSRKMIMRALPSAFREEDVTITQAANGREALDAYHAGKADLMFLDLTMPEMDGFAVLEHLKAEEANVIVVVISADIQPEAQRRVKELGAAAFVRKPVREDVLQETLHTIGLV
ncbi:response regulator [Hahella sp. SMD15-11]|uniref:Response regulator n=1 Tax=Thermohahella caldifontis TaxID=3142973 RepID=A0AB39UT08_9GAMM